MTPMRKYEVRAPNAATVIIGGALGSIKTENPIANTNAITIRAYDETRWAWRSASRSSVVTGESQFVSLKTLEPRSCTGFTFLRFFVIPLWARRSRWPAWSPVRHYGNCRVRRASAIGARTIADHNVAVNRDDHGLTSAAARKTSARIPGPIANCHGRGDCD